MEKKETDEAIQKQLMKQFFHGLEKEVFFYYIMDEKKLKNGDIVRKPVITVCLIKSSVDAVDCIARGVTVCSDSEMPIKKRGRAIAKGKAMQALFHKVSGEPVKRTEALKVLERMQIGSLILSEGKCAYNPVLTAFEERLLTNASPMTPFRVKEMTYEKPEKKLPEKPTKETE